jgi:5-aminolevulinate synthase
MDEDLEIRTSAESPGSAINQAINQATRAHFANAIQRLKDERRYRVFIDLDRDATRFPTAVWRPNGSQEQHEVTIWCSNDYLGMGGHPEIREAAVAAVERHGAGAGGTRNISGTHHRIVELEAALSHLVFLLLITGLRTH